MPLDANVVGTVEAFSTVAVRAQVTGELKEVNFRQGDDVQAGQVLFTLDHRPLEAALNQAEAIWQRNTAQSANAKVIAQRMDDLVERGVGTREQRDTARTTAAALEAIVGADTAAVENAKVQLQYATIRAPIAGRTGALMVNAGNLVRANDQTPLVVINQVRPIYASFGIPEALLPDLRRYMAQRELSVEALPPNEELRPGEGKHLFRRQPGRPDDRHDPHQGHVPERESPALAGAVRQRAGEAHLRSARDCGAVGRRAGGARRTIRLRREGRSDRRNAPGHRRADGGKRNGSQGRRQTRRNGRHRWPAAARAGQPHQHQGRSSQKADS